MSLIGMLYTHQVLGEEKLFPNGYYTPLNEVKIKYGNRDLLCITGQASVETSCCGANSWSYIQVVGYINDWHCKSTESGDVITDISPIQDEQDQAAIKKLIQETEGNLPVEFM